MATQVATGYEIERIHTPGADELLMRQVVALQHVLDSEERPEDPPYPPEIVEARFRATSPLFERTEWGAFGDGRLVGLAAFVQQKSGKNQHIREVRIGVHPEHRRRGVGRALFAAGLAGIADGDAKLVEWWSSTRVPAAEAVSRRIGAKRGLHMRVSQVELATIDRDLMRRWAAIDPAGYRLEWVIGDVPDHLMAPGIQAFNAINRMPKEDLEVEDFDFSEERIRDWERIRKLRGMESSLVLAIEDATGAGVGFTDVVFDRRYHYVIHQGGTAVDLAHQGKSIGKWLKARMALRLLEDFPEARVIRTDNAGTNAKMLAINDQMGFKEAWWGDVWQVPLGDAKRYVRERGL